MNLNTIFFIGPQGSGKGTQAKILAQKLRFFYPAPFSVENTANNNINLGSPNIIAEAMKTGKWSGVYWEMGGILRQVALEKSDLGQKVKNLIDNGVLLNDEQLYEVVDSRLGQIPPDKGVIFDGIPRRLGQAQHLMNFLKKQGRGNFTTLFIDLPLDETFNRLLKRAEIEGRKDDTREKIEFRLKQYQQDTVPVLDYLKTQSNFIQIDGLPAVEQVTQDINRQLGLM